MQDSSRASAHGRRASPTPVPPKIARERIARISVYAMLCPQLLPRVLGLVAQHALVPLTIMSQRRRTTMRLDIEVDGLPEAATAILVEKIRAIITVRSAQLRRTRPRR